MIGKVMGEQIKLRDVKATFNTPFVSVIFTPLDNLPLATSRKILVTALARDKQAGAAYSDDGTKLTATGTAPLLLEPVQATIQINGAKPSRIQPLDHYGVPMKSDVPVAADGSFRIDGTFRAYYYEVVR